MIVTQGTTGLGSGVPLPVAAAGAPAAADTAPGAEAFDALFRQLTGGGPAASFGGGVARHSGDEPAPDDGTAADATADTTVPVLVAPVVVPALPLEMAVTAPAGNGGHSPAGVSSATDAVVGDDPTRSATATPTAGRSATAFETAAAMPAVTGGRAADDQVARPPERLADADVTGPTSPDGAALDRLFAPADAGGSDAPGAGKPASAADSETSTADVPVNGRGLDGRRGIGETRARARASSGPEPAGRTFERPAQAGTSPATGEAPPAVDVPVPSATTSAPLPPVSGGEPVPGAAGTRPPVSERAAALQRALARQTAHRGADAVAPGLATQAAIATPAGAESGAGHDPQGRRQGRTSTGVPSTSTPASPSTPVGAAGSGAPSSHVDESVPALRASWRAALATAGATDGAATAADTPRLPTPAPAAAWPAGPAGPAIDLPALRDRGPIVLDGPVAVRELDQATAEAVHTQIIKSLRMQWGGGLSEAKVTLRPEYLGEVTASIKVEQGAVTATLHADTPEVRRFIDTHVATLREALVEHGLKLDRLTVAEPERQQAQGERQGRPRQRQQEAPRQRPRRQTDEAPVPFDLTPE